jgi:hypothetical protein
LRLLETLRGRVHAHQYLIANGHGSVHDFVLPALRHPLPFRARRPVVTKQAVDFSTEAFFVQLECFLALPTEMKMRIQSHDTTPLFDIAGVQCFAPFGIDLSRKTASHLSRIRKVGHRQLRISGYAAFAGFGRICFMNSRMVARWPGDRVSTHVSYRFAATFQLLLSPFRFFASCPRCSRVRDLLALSYRRLSAVEIDRLYEKHFNPSS